MLLLWRCRYSEDVTYGELFLQNEYEMSCYNLDEADVAEQRKRFNLYEAEVSSSNSWWWRWKCCRAQRCCGFQSMRQSQLFWPMAHHPVGVQGGHQGAACTHPQVARAPSKHLSMHTAGAPHAVQAAACARV